MDSPDDEAVVFGDGSAEVTVIAVFFTAFAVHTRSADEDTDGNLEEVCHLQQYGNIRRIETRFPRIDGLFGHAEEGTESRLG